jgi:uncharacterized protein
MTEAASTVAPGIDRTAPRVRPSELTVMRQSWRHLLFLHWEVPAEQVRPLVPEPLTLDLYQGRCYVGLIPFTITGSRPPLAPPVPGLSSFHEVNLRTYVHLAGQDPGVWFFSLDASSSLAVAGARAVYQLPYHRAEIDFEIESSPERYVFSSRRRQGMGRCTATYAPLGDPQEAVAGSIEDFLIERYVLFAGGPKRLIKARVHHSPYPIQQVLAEGVEESLFAAAGLEPARGEPMVCYSRGVAVRIYPPWRAGR